MCVLGVLGCCIRNNAVCSNRTAGVFAILYLLLRGGLVGMVCKVVCQCPAAGIGATRADAQKGVLEEIEGGTSMSSWDEMDIYERQRFTSRCRYQAAAAAKLDRKRGQTARYRDEEEPIPWRWRSPTIVEDKGKGNGGNK